MIKRSPPTKRTLFFYILRCRHYIKEKEGTMKRSILILTALALTSLFLFTACGSYPDELTLDPPAGAYAEDSLTIHAASPKGTVIRYTTDGSLPASDSPVLEKELTLSGEGNRWLDEETAAELTYYPDFGVHISEELPAAHIIRAQAFRGDEPEGPVKTATYFTGLLLSEKYPGLPVISLVTEPASLLDYQEGILVKGAVFDEWSKTKEGREALDRTDWLIFSGNFTQKGRDWERETSLELFDASDEETLQQDAGIRIKGGMSRLMGQKSLNVYLREDYGKDTLSYPLLPAIKNQQTGETVSEYESFSLRNGGNDARYMKYKDSWLQSLFAGSDLDFFTQGGRPAVLFLNGEFWGVTNLQAKYDSFLLEQMTGAKDPIIVKAGEVDDGPEEEGMALYEDWYSFSEKDLSDPAVWEDFCRATDVESMADYYAAQIYIGNQDVSDGSNVSVWRSLEEDPESPCGDGRWRYLLYDTELSSNLYSNKETSPTFDSISYLAGRCKVFGAALKNSEFRALLLASIKEVSELCSYERVESTLSQWDGEWAPLIHDHDIRFGDSDFYRTEGIKGILYFFRERKDFLLPLAEDLLG